MKILRQIFTPFTKVSKETYMMISLCWIAIIAVLWQNAPTLIPKPLEVGTQIITYLSDKNFYYDIYASLELTIVSMSISILIACLAAYLSTTPAFNLPVKIIMMLRFMSLLGFLFIFMSLLNGESGKVKNALLIFSIVPYFTLSLVTVISKIPQKEFDLWTTLRYNRWEQLYQIVIIGKADTIIDAIFSNFSMAWVMMTLAETKAMADGGLGVELFKADKYNHVDQVIALQFIIYTLGLFMMLGIKQLRYKLFPYTALAEKH
jgi:ABC-type nitrate/sulfonate/bicarbonate transport system permease component